MGLKLQQHSIRCFCFFVPGIPLSIADSLSTSQGYPAFVPNQETRDFLFSTPPGGGRVLPTGGGYPSDLVGPLLEAGF